MICFHSCMPLLRVGQHDVSHYEAHWLEGVIRQAAREAGHDGWWPAEEVARGVLQFLRDRFDSNIITIHELFQKLGHTLRTIGFADIASHIRAEPPPMEICLWELARVSDGLELAFFQRLKDELAELRQAGATRIEAVNLRPAVLGLLSTAQWNCECGRLEQEIVEFARSTVGRTGGAGSVALLLSR